jgi:hypothetical protein
MQHEKDFTTSIVVDQSPQEVFNATNNVRGWWQGEITGDTLKLDGEFTYKMEPYHYSKQRIVEMVPDEKVVWQVSESKINFVENKNEWVDTKIIFDISSVGNQTRLHFTHRGLVPEIECYGSCSQAWGQLIEQSLYSLITTGKGVDVF